MEAERESDNPTESGDDMSSLKDEEEDGGGAATASAEHREPAALPVGGSHGTGAPSDAPESSKRAVGEDVARGQEAKRARSSCHLEAPPASHPSAPSVAERVDRSGGHDCSPLPSWSARAPCPQQRDAPRAIPVVSP